MNKLTKPLIKLGLTEKEALVYLSLLELEKAPVQDIARKSKVNRSTCYVALESLHEQGFVDISADKAVREYLPLSPENLINTARCKAKEQAKILDMMEEIGPKLNSLRGGLKEKPKVLVYEGENNVKRSLFDVLDGNMGEKLRVYENKGNLDYLDLYPNIAHEDSQYRAKNKNQLLMIAPRNSMSVEYKKVSEEYPENNDIIILTEEHEMPSQFKETADFSVCGNKVIIYSIDDGFSVLIENKKVADALKGLFDFTWKKVVEKK